LLKLLVRKVECQADKYEAAEITFLRVMSGYRLTNYRRNEDIRVELKIVDTNSRMKDMK
jgi:hypothetical protein